MENEKKRLFFGMSVKAPWPEALPQGRVVPEVSRHMTLVFLGDIDYAPLEEILPTFPVPPFAIGWGGVFDKLLFLPPRHPHVVSWRVDLLGREEVASFGVSLAEWLVEKRILGRRDERPFLPHVTLARQPFEVREWRKAFSPLPCYSDAIHLYESKKNLAYEPIWSWPLEPPLEEIPHTADIAFRVVGRGIEELAMHAQLALACGAPALLRYFVAKPDVRDLGDIVVLLNEQIRRLDEVEGAPLKAVSYAGRGIEEKKNRYEWEMIVDV